MHINATLKSIIDFSNFFDHQLFVHHAQEDVFFSVKSGVIKQIKMPPQMSALISDPKILTKPMSSGGEKSFLHIFRLGDGHTLMLQDPGTGNVINSLIMSLITLSSNACAVTYDSAEKDMNDILLDKLVAEFDTERKKFSIANKRQKEEIIILEEQAKDAYEQMQKAQDMVKDKDKTIVRLQTQLIELAENYKNLDKKMNELNYSSDFKIGNDIKKKNEVLRENNKLLVDTIKKTTETVEEYRTNVVMTVTDFMDALKIDGSSRDNLLGSINEIFSQNTPEA